MWAVSDKTRMILAGDHFVSPVMSASYGDKVTVPQLGVASGVITKTLTDQVARETLSVTVDDDLGELIPIKATDPLAPYGQTVTVSLRVSAGEADDQIPMGTFLIDQPEPTGGWRLWRGQTIPTGGTVRLQCSDLVQRLVECEIAGLMQPAGTRVRDEVYRLCAGVVPVNITNIPAGETVGTNGLLYEPSRLDNVKTLLAGTGMVIAPSRAGVVTVVDLPSEVSKRVTIDSAEWVSSEMNQSRDRIYNTWVTSNAVGEETIRGVAVEKGGAFGADAPLGPRIYRHSSPVYADSQSAQKGAETLKRHHIEERQIRVRVETTFDPTVDVGDLHQVEIVPGKLAVTARLVKAAIPLTGGLQVHEYEIAREEVEAWRRLSN